MRHLQREVNRLTRDVLGLSALVEETLRDAFRAIERRDAPAARRVIAADIAIDVREVDVEEECLKILALYQPVAGDLPNIAERAIQLADAPYVPIPSSLFVMAERVQVILEKALDALVAQDATRARLVLAADDEIDELYRRLLEELKAELRDDLEHLDAVVLLFSVARYLERLADHATNIAEDVLYMVEGEILRHQPPDLAAEPPDRGFSVERFSTD